jgi:hypothetical protein
MKTVFVKFNSYKEELSYVELLKKEKSFLLENGYDVDLPEIFDENVYKKNKKNYGKLLLEFEKKWNSEDKLFYSKIEDFFGRMMDKSIKIKFTAYGSGGHYDLKNDIVIVKINSPYDPIFIIKHEIVHLLLEPYILKYKVNHKNKEKLIDAILEVLLEK